jgi:imidazolonepropionase
LTDRGKLTSSQLADFILFPTADYREILYQQGKMKPEMVWRKGNLKYEVRDTKYGLKLISNVERR